jgi:predicted 2-oxoglutarate/Fe(II)-dependent dioxygenase YbiX
MEFTYIADGIDAVVIDNFYSQEQLKEIMDEVKWLTKKSVLVDPSQLSTAENEHGSMAQKTGVFLERVFMTPNQSALITHPITNLLKPEIKTKIESFNSLFRILYSCNTRTHLLSYYEEDGFYKAHTDSSVFTIFNWFNTEPKNFTGGNNILFSSNSSKQAEVEFRNNRVVIIPGCCVHEVKDIKMNNKEPAYSGNGRYCNSIFMMLGGDNPPVGVSYPQEKKK